MEKEPHKVIDLNIKKMFDMKMKPGNDMRHAHLDESNNVNSMFFLKGSRLYHIDLVTKKICECEFSKGNEIIYMTGNSNNLFLLCVFKSGKIIAINSTTSKIFKNINVTNLISKKEINLNKFQVFASNDLEKLIIVTDCFIIMWYQNNIMSKIHLNELSGTFFNISKEEEIKTLAITGYSSSSNDNCCWNENIAALFNNNYYLGSFCKVFYVLTIPFTTIKKTKIVIIEYLFSFDYNNKFRLVTENDSNYQYSIFDDLSMNENEELNDIRTNTFFGFLPIFQDKSKEKIVMKPNLHGNILAICLNYQNKANTTIIFFMCDTYSFSSCKIKTLLGDKQPSLVQDMDWLCNDMFLLILFTNGTFMLINVDFQIILLKDSSNCILPDDLFYTPIHYNINKPKEGDYPKLIVSKLRDDYFFIYSRAYAICFKANYSQYESRLINCLIPLDNFDDFLFELKFFQMYLSSSEFNTSPDVDINMSVFDIIHQYLMSTLSSKSIYGINREANVQSKSETVNNINRSFVQYIRIFRAINQTHETNLTIITYLIRRSNDFFIHLLNHHEIWLATLFLGICEMYLLKPMKLQRTKGKSFTGKEANNYIKQDMSYILFHPKEIENISFKSYTYLNNIITYSRLRLILLFFCLIEFRNNFALSINVLYFVLAKFCITKIKQNNMLDEVLSVMKIIIKSYKYLKNENEKKGKEEFILNCLTMSYRNEALAQITISNTERFDISFNFFGDFYSFDEFASFTELNENYCKNDDVNQINDYNSLNNVGIIQKWILLFTNYLYEELFQDVKNYLDNHYRQTFAKERTSGENISPEEKTLSTLVYFNVDFFFTLISFYFKAFLSIIIQKDNTRNQSSINAYDISLMEKYYKTYLPFLSPVEVPFLIFEFYLEESNPEKKNLPYEIKQCLFNHIEQKAKQFNMTIDDSLDFIDFLISNGFMFHSEGSNGEMENIQSSLTKMQRYIYSAFMFYLFIIHKTNMIFLYQSENELILSVLDSFESSLKKECYEYLFITLNGHLRYYLKKEFTAKINENESKYIEIILPLIKHLFYKMLIEESYIVRKNISEIVYMTPSVIKSYLIEGALYYEYKNLNRLLKSSLFSFNDVLSLSAMKNFANVKESNYFDAIFSHNALSLLFQENSIQNILSTLNNLLNLCKVDKELIFNIESNREYINKLILNSINSDENNETQFNELIYLTIDKIIKGNFENKAHFQYSNNEFKNKLIRTIKVVLAKLLHLLHIIFIKIKIISSSPSKDILQYIRMISSCLFYENNPINAVEWTNKIIDYIAELNFNTFKVDSQKENVLEILKNIKIISIKYKISESSTNKLEEVIKKLQNDNNTIYIQYNSFVNNILSHVKKVFNKTKGIKSNNLKYFIISTLNDNYLDNIYTIYNQIHSYLISSTRNEKTLLKYARKKYINLSDQFYNLTGISVKGFIEFKKNWQLVENEQLYQLIVNDHIDDMCQIQKEENTSLLMNRRQKIGVETPRRKTRLAYRRDQSPIDSSRRNRPRADSLHIREEDVKPELKLKNKIKNRIPKCINKKDNNQQRTIIDQKQIIDFNNKIRLLILLRFKKQIQLKVDTNQVNNLLNGKNNDIKFLNIKPKEHSIENKETVKHDTEEKGGFHSIKPFDIINIKKMPTIENAKQISINNIKKINPNTLKKSKFDELTEKLNKCENMVLNMGKQFVEGSFIPQNNKNE